MGQLGEDKTIFQMRQLGEDKRIFRMRQLGEHKGFSGCDNLEKKDFPDATLGEH
jgi:hypothetical protein